MLRMLSVDANLTGNVHSPSRFDFDAEAETYDQWYETPPGPMYDRFQKKAVSRCLPLNAQGRKLLEVGCGTGHWTKFFSECGFEVTGVDVSKSMIRIAQSKNIPGASFQIADAHSLPYNDNCFDVTAAITTLEFVRDAEAVLQEMARCTRKPSGKLVVGVLNALAGLNRSRQENSESLYAEARLFTPSQLRELLSRYGKTRLSTVGFVPRRKCLLPLSPVVDAIGRLFQLKRGVFIAAEVWL
jgi:ubiquinone/menaquinone biosynthesis C-methylase UbiE